MASSVVYRRNAYQPSADNAPCLSARRRGKSTSSQVAARQGVLPVHMACAELGHNVAQVISAEPDRRALTRAIPFSTARREYAQSGVRTNRAHCASVLFCFARTMFQDRLRVERWRKVANWLLVRPVNCRSAERSGLMDEPTTHLDVGSID